MLHLTVVAVGKQKEPWMRQGTEEYLKRLGAYCAPRVLEVEEYRLPENPGPAQIQKGLAEEGRRILEKLGKTPYAALCIEGREFSSPEFAEWLGERQQTDGSLGLIIGGSYGLSREVKEGACLRLSLSPMTFPHQLFRVMLLEQLYRAFSILGGGKYHK